MSWLAHGPFGWLAMAATLGLALAAAIAARHFQRVLPAGPPRDAAVALLACAVALGVAMLLLPSRGVGEPVWRTALHLGLAVGTYAAILGAAVIAAWVQGRHGLAGPRMAAWAAVVAVGLSLLGVAAGVARLTPSGMELRGVAQLGLIGAGALWLAAATRLGPPGASQ